MLLYAMGSYLRVIVLLIVVLSACSRQPVYPPPSVSGGDAVVDISMLKPEIPQFFTYPFQGKKISFFVIRMDQKILAFFDACASCYPGKRGYRYEQGCITCRSCDMNFSVYKLEKGLGGCYPIRIEGRTENGKYLIPLDTLRTAAGKF